ncbi:hypothetical protein [Planomicrobium sp. CPCC 101079]|uniref:hypothetical protein n=1 Tax=Planomicrobium sp. CPCC 101079 TaxID=2599618 RepID=UPI00164941A2|nr:hypothetical protein [Planomicrobium sp. CPCC 101079]
MKEEYSRAIAEMQANLNFLRVEHTGNEECLVLIEEIEMNLAKLNIKIGSVENEESTQ